MTTAPFRRINACTWAQLIEVDSGRRDCASELVTEDKTKVPAKAAIARPMAIEGALRKELLITASRTNRLFKDTCSKGNGIGGSTVKLYQAQQIGTHLTAFEDRLLVRLTVPLSVQAESDMVPACFPKAVFPRAVFMALCSRTARPDRMLGNPYAAQEQDRVARLEEILKSVPHVMTILETVRNLSLPDAWLVSGGIYQTVWNVMTGRPLMHGIKDFDIIYFDGTNLSYEAEDAIIKKVNAALPDLANLLEIRNQARVHLWYEQRFGRPYLPLDCSMDSLTSYAARTHAVAARQDETGGLVIQAPFGLANLFAMRLVPNYSQPYPETYAEKAIRMKTLWPELEIVPWDDARK